MRIKPKHWAAAWTNDYEKLPRKIKKYFLGKRIGKSKIKSMIKNRHKSEYFCPKCGCGMSWTTGNMTAYPEVYEESFCSRCGFMVCIADNSKPCHVLDQGGDWI